MVLSIGVTYSISGLHRQAPMTDKALCNLNHKLNMSMPLDLIPHNEKDLAHHAKFLGLYSECFDLVTRL